MRIVVTGGAGYIGAHTVHALVERGADVAVVDNLATGHREFIPSSVRLHELDIRDKSRLAEVLISEKPDAVIHLAARALVGEDAREPDLYRTTNIDGTISLLEAMVCAGTSCLVFSSSCAVYGEPKMTPIDETHPLAPLSLYGETKMAAEKAIVSYGIRHKIRWAILRYFNAAGAASSGRIGEWHDPETHLIPLTICAALGKSGPLCVFGADYPTMDGTAVRDYVHVDDLANAHIRALTAKESFIFNLGTGCGSSVGEIIRAVEKYSGLPVPRDIVGRRAGDPSRLTASAARAEQTLGWRATHDLDDIVASAFNWEKSRG